MRALHRHQGMFIKNFMNAKEVFFGEVFCVMLAKLILYQIHSYVGNRYSMYYGTMFANISLGDFSQENFFRGSEKIMLISGCSLPGHNSLPE